MTVNVVFITLSTFYYVNLIILSYVIFPISKHLKVNKTKFHMINMIFLKRSRVNKIQKLASKCLIPLTLLRKLLNEIFSNDFIPTTYTDIFCKKSLDILFYLHACHSDSLEVMTSYPIILPYRLKNFPYILIKIKNKFCILLFPWDVWCK